LFFLVQVQKKKDAGSMTGMRQLSAFFICLVLGAGTTQLAWAQDFEDGLPKPNTVLSCYSTKPITKGLCNADGDCADDTEKCFRQVCIAKHTLEKTSYRTGMVDTIIEKWPPLNEFNDMPLMQDCEPEMSYGCYITRYVDWPPGTNTHLASTDNAGFRGGCSNGYYEMDSNLRLEEGCMLHTDGTRTISCFCSDRDDCNMAWKGESLRGEGYENEGANASSTTADLSRTCQMASVLAVSSLAFL
jgi:hypothetical protein